MLICQESLYFSFLSNFSSSLNPMFRKAFLNIIFLWRIFCHCAIHIFLLIRVKHPICGCLSAYWNKIVYIDSQYNMKKSKEKYFPCVKRNKFENWINNPFMTLMGVSFHKSVILCNINSFPILCSFRYLNYKEVNIVGRKHHVNTFCNIKLFPYDEIRHIIHFAKRMVPNEFFWFWRQRYSKNWYSKHTIGGKHQILIISLVWN